MQRIVVALGGNALGNSPSEQIELVKNTAKIIVDLAQEGNEIIITHGNGPQVGMINLSFDYSYNKGTLSSKMPFAECGAMSQGYIGYHLEQAIITELNKRQINKNCMAIITEVLVNKEDKAFSNPTKPIGMFYTENEAKKIEKETGYKFVDDAKRGFRRVVPSPKPVKIIELELIKHMLSQENILIVAGGGGIPVIEDNGILKGIDAVIDKDRTSALLAKEINADILLILTTVDKVSLNYNTPNQIDLDIITYNDAKKYIEEGQFAKGSMLPKIEAILDYLNNTKNNVGIITSLKNAKKALDGQTGTKIIK